MSKIQHDRGFLTNIDSEMMNKELSKFWLRKPCSFVVLVTADSHEKFFEIWSIEKLLLHCPSVLRDRLLDLFELQCLLVVFIFS